MSNHRITAEIGEGLKVDIDYSYRPPTPGSSADSDYPAEMEVIKAHVVGDEKFNEVTPVYVRELAQNWLDDEGYDDAVALAERERHGDRE